MRDRESCNVPGQGHQKRMAQCYKARLIFLAFAEHLIDGLMILSFVFRVLPGGKSSYHEEHGRPGAAEPSPKNLKIPLLYLPRCGGEQSGGSAPS